MNLMKEFTKGIGEKNPILLLGIGLCPTLAVTTSVSNAIWMTIATTFVLLCSNVIVSLIRNFVPFNVRIPIYITIIATFVIVVELSLQAFQPQVYKSLGLFIPLIVVNCMILGRAEEYAAKHSILPSVIDALGMGAGFGVALIVLAFIRETVGAGTLFGYTIVSGFNPIGFFSKASGAFVVLGILIWFIKARNSKKV